MRAGNFLLMYLMQSPTLFVAFTHGFIKASRDNSTLFGSTKLYAFDICYKTVGGHNFFAQRRLCVLLFLSQGKHGIFV